MKTDSLFYRLFQTFPRCFFDLLGLPPDIVDRYRFASVEVKQLAFRIDGVFLPDGDELPIYFLEVQFQWDSKFYSRFFSEIFLYLHRTELTNDWRGAVIFPGRAVDNGETSRYHALLENGNVTRFYLDELDDTDSVGIETLKLIIESETSAMERGRTLIQQVRQEFIDSSQRDEILKLIETILIYKLPRMNRREIEAMFSIGDLKETRVYQEALEEGREQERLTTIRRMVASGFSDEQIALALGSAIEEVRRIIASDRENGNS